jgi:hypothetical protein
MPVLDETLAMMSLLSRVSIEENCENLAGLCIRTFLRSVFTNVKAPIYQIV